MVRVTFCNDGGELDSRTAKDEAEAALMAVAMITEAGELYDGDRIEITEVPA